MDRWIWISTEYILLNSHISMKIVLLNEQCNKSRRVQDWIQHIQGPRAGAVWHKGLHLPIEP